MKNKTTAVKPPVPSAPASAAGVVSQPGNVDVQLKTSLPRRQQLAIEVMTITPQLGTEFLTKNTRNRPMRPGHVKHLQHEIENNWKLNGDTICFGWDGSLLDGQHRLAAGIAANKPFVSLVVTGLDPDIFDTKDIGKRRTAADSLALRGEANAKDLAATLQVVDRYNSRRMASAPYYSPADVESLLAQNPDVRASVRFVSEHPTKLLPASILAACHFLFAQVDRKAADSLVDRLVSGTGLTEGDAVYILRERLIANTTAKAKLSPQYIAALLVKAWNFTVTKEPVKFLRFREEGKNPETFPVVATIPTQQKAA